MADDEVRSRAAEVNEQLRPIELTAETVTRPAGPQTPTVHSFLRHLRSKGLDCVPEPVSLDGEAETLRFIEGESGGDGWRHQHDEKGLRSAARLLRCIHDASADWVPPDDAVFHRIHYTNEHVRLLAALGQEPQRTWVAEGSVEEELAEIAWIEENRSLFSR